MTQDRTQDKTLDLVAIGEALVEFNRRDPASTAYWMGFGGDTSNCVIAAARLGARCAYITQLGDDAFGGALLALWRRERIATEGVRLLPGAPTGLYFVEHGATGHRFSYRRSGSAASLMTPAGLPRELVARARRLHCSGLSQAISASARETVAQAIAVARAHGTLVSYDLNYRPALIAAADALQLLRATLPHCDLFLPSVDEFQALTGLSQPDDIMAWCRDHGARAVVLKQGAQGCTVWEGGERVAVPATPVRPVDATGAGDGFAGACLAELLRGQPLLAAARLACRAAALSTQVHGAVDSYPRRDQLEPQPG